MNQSPKPQPREALYRRLHAESLQENRPDLHQALQKSGQLQAHLQEVGKASARDHLSHVQHLKKHEPYSPKKHGSPRQYENSLNERARELVLHDRVLVPSPSDQPDQPDSPIESARPTTSASPAPSNGSGITSMPSRPFGT